VPTAANNFAKLPLAFEINVGQVTGDRRLGDG
jgi:hypothetical protein